jgi:hypothetical protein
MSYRIKEIIEPICIVLTVAAVAVFILVAGNMIGASAAHDTRVKYEFQLECIERGGHIENVDEYGSMCRL